MRYDGTLHKASHPKRESQQGRAHTLHKKAHNGGQPSTCGPAGGRRSEHVGIMQYGMNNKTSDAARMTAAQGAEHASQLSACTQPLRPTRCKLASVAILSLDTLFPPCVRIAVSEKGPQLVVNCHEAEFCVEAPIPHASDTHGSPMLTAPCSASCQNSWGRPELAVITVTKREPPSTHPSPIPRPWSPMLT